MAEACLARPPARKRPKHGHQRFVLAWLVGCWMTASSRADESVTMTETVRFATYNVSLYGKGVGDVERRLASGDDRQARDLARVIQTVRPDVLLLNEIDFDEDGKTLDLFAERYLGVDIDDTAAIEFPYRYSIPSNTGVDSTLDINRDGQSGGPNDAWGYGVYPGQYAMAVLSQFPIDESSVRTFQTFRWCDFPDALQPIDPKTQQPFYPEELWSTLRLSSKNHADVPIVIGKRRVHLLASHPTPPVFDGPEDRNGCRNHDEIRFWTEYLDVESSRALVDDHGQRGGLGGHELFIIAGDLNADVGRGDGRHESILKLLEHPRLFDPEPKHVLPAGASESVGRARLSTTAAFGGRDGMRVDYVLPSRTMTLRDSGVFWPSESDPRRKMINASDHRLVWVEVTLP